MIGFLGLRNFVPTPRPHLRAEIARRTFVQTPASKEAGYRKATWCLAQLLSLFEFYLCCDCLAIAHYFCFHFIAYFAAAERVCEIV